MESTCKNCEHGLLPEYDYCPKCSQKVNLHRLSMHDVFHEGFHYFTHADKGLLILLRDLISKPGVVAREFVDGKRKKHFSPLTFFLLVAAILVFFFSLQTAPKSISPEILETLSPRQIRGMKVGLFFNRYSNFVAMLALPLTALIFWLSYKRTRYNYAEHLVACMYMIGFYLLCYAIVILPVVKLLDAPSNTAVITLFILQIIYASIYYYNFINRKTTAGKLKAFGVSLASTAIWGLLSSFVVQTYITTGFWGLIS